MRKDLCNARAKHDPNVQHVYYSTLVSQCSLFQFISGAYAIYLTIPRPLAPDSNESGYTPH